MMTKHQKDLRVPTLHRHQIVDDIKRVFIDMKAFIFGYSLYWTFMFVLFWGELFSEGHGIMSTWFVSVVPSTVVLFIAMLVPKTELMLSKPRIFSFILAACLSFGVIGIVLAKYISPEFHLFGSALTGVGLGPLTLFFGWLLSGCRLSQAFMVSALSALLAAVFALLITSLDPLPAYTLMTLIPFISSWFCFKALAYDSLRRNEQLEEIPYRSQKTLFVVVITAAVLIGLLLGMIRGILHVVVNSHIGIHLFSLMTIVVGFYLLAFGYLSKKGSPSVLFASIIIVTAVFAIVACLARNDIVAFAIHTASTSYFIANFRVFCAAQARRSKRRYQVLAGGQCIFQIGQILGMLFNDFIGFRLFEKDSVASNLALLAAFSMLALTVIILTRLSTTKKDSQKEYQVTAAELSNLIPYETGLTEREKEILAYYTQGQTRSFIAEQLYISPETVKTHLSHVYAKLGVHSKQELFDYLSSLSNNGFLF